MWRRGSGTALYTTVLAFLSPGFLLVCTPGDCQVVGGGQEFLPAVPLLPEITAVLGAQRVSPAES